jgi:hypothetical protein
MANRLADGKLPELLTERRAAGQSWDDISREIYALGIEVTAETLRRWFELLTTTDTEAVA